MRSRNFVAISWGSLAGGRAARDWSGFQTSWTVSATHAYRLVCILNPAPWCKVVQPATRCRTVQPATCTMNPAPGATVRATRCVVLGTPYCGPSTRGLVLHPTQCRQLGYGLGYGSPPRPGAGVAGGPLPAAVPRRPLVLKRLLQQTPCFEGPAAQDPQQTPCFLG